MAAMAALRHFKKEEVEVRGDEVTVVRVVCIMPGLRKWLTLVCLRSAQSNRESTGTIGYPPHPTMCDVCLPGRVSRDSTTSAFPLLCVLTTGSLLQHQSRPGPVPPRIIDRNRHSDINNQRSA